MLREITSAELAELEAFCIINGPVGDERADWRIAKLAAHVIAPWLKQGSNPPTVDELRIQFQADEEAGEVADGLDADDGLPDEEPPPTPIPTRSNVATTPEEMKRLLKRMTIMTGGKVGGDDR
jgi:hypothetical protein